jgi:hypothetical protein
LESRKSLFVLALASACCVFAFPARAQGPIGTPRPAAMTHTRIAVSDTFNGVPPGGEGKNPDSALNCQKNRITIPFRSEITNAAFSFMSSLPQFLSSEDRGSYRKRWKDESFIRSVEAWEARAVSIECVLDTSKKEGRETCNGNKSYLADYHLSLVNSNTDSSPIVIAEITPRWWSKFEELKRITRHNGERVRITGWLMWDNHHTQWEIHPVTRVQFWDETSGKWDDLSKELGDLAAAAR